MNGDLILENAGLQFPYLNIDYNFDGDTYVRLNGQSFEFDNINLLDSKYETRGVLDGTITHQNFDQWALDIDILSPNLLVLDTNNSDEALYYGTGFIKGNASIAGLTNNITINVNAKTMPNTNFVIPLKDIAKIDTYRLIHFKSEKTLEELQELADKDLKINDTELDLESIKTPQIHNKYLKFLYFIFYRPKIFFPKKLFGIKSIIPMLQTDSGGITTSIIRTKRNASKM